MFSNSPKYQIGNVQNFYTCRGNRSLDVDFDFGECDDLGEGGSRPGRLDEIERELLRIRGSFSSSFQGEGSGSGDFYFEDDYDL
jgi:hypothetical protein